MARTIHLPIAFRPTAYLRQATNGRGNRLMTNTVTTD